MQSGYELAPMADWDGDDRLNETDIAILELLENGRETTGSIADRLDKHPQTVRDRLRWLREWGYVRYHHESTGLHELEIDTPESDGGVVTRGPEQNGEQPSAGVSEDDALDCPDCGLEFDTFDELREHLDATDADHA